MPRTLTDMDYWLDMEFPLLGSHAIRVEDYQERDRYVLRAELPGIDPDRDVKVTIEGGVLTVEATRSEQEHDKHRSEFRYGSMRRSVTLPPTAQQDKISARYDKGILEVVVPLTSVQPTGRAIPVEHAG